MLALKHILYMSSHEENKAVKSFEKFKLNINCDEHRYYLIEIKNAQIQIICNKQFDMHGRSHYNQIQYFIEKIYGNHQFGNLFRKIIYDEIDLCKKFITDENIEQHEYDKIIFFIDLIKNRKIQIDNKICEYNKICEEYNLLKFK